MKWVCCGAVAMVIGCVGGGGASATVQPGGGPAMRSIHVIVNVRTETGDPIDRVLIGASVTTEGLSARTDATGVASIQGQIPAEAGALSVFLSPVSNATTVDQVSADMSRFEEVDRTFTFRRYYTIALQAAITDYQITIVGYPSVTVTGRLVNPQAAPVPGSISRRDAPTNGTVDSETGRFQVRGVRRGQPAELYARGRSGGLVTVLRLTGAQTSSDVDLGDIVLPAPQATAPVSIHVQDLLTIPKGLQQSGRTAIVLISTDGETIFEFPLTPGGDAKASRVSAGMPTVSVGTYYVCPGPMEPNLPAQNLLDLIRAGRLADLDAASAVRIVVTAGGPNTVQFSALAALSAIRSLHPDD